MSLAANLKLWMDLRQQADEAKERLKQLEKERDAKMGEIFQEQAATRGIRHDMGSGGYVIEFEGKNYYLFCNNTGNQITYKEVKVL